VRTSAVVLLCCLSTSTTSSLTRAAGKAVDGAVNLNTAPPEVLALLPGIGPAKAQSIVVYRTKHPFRTIDELVRIKGIGHKMVRRLRAHLAVGGPTTATPSSAARRRHPYRRRHLPSDRRRSRADVRRFRRRDLRGPRRPPSRRTVRARGPRDGPRS
jgi:competence ComEA-like helix-hairpin-helix protein